MRKITKSLLTLALLVLAVGAAKADNASLNQLEAAYGSTSDWLNSIPASYPVNVLDATIFGSDANYQTTNANVNNYDYIYFEVTNFVSARAVRVFFWDPNTSSRINYYLKPVADKETADFSIETPVSANGTYCVKIPDGARLQGAKTPWIQNGASDPYFKFSQIYLTERATPYVELVPYTLEWTPNAGIYRAIIPISESHIRTTGNVSINYNTGEVTNTGSGTLVIYLNSEDLVGAKSYILTTSNSSLLGSSLDISDAVNGEVGGIYGSRNSWNIAGDASRKDKIGAVKSLKYNFSESGSWTITSIYFDADQLIAETTNKNLADMPYGIWGAPANVISSYTGVDSYKTNNIGGGAESLTYGHDGISDANKYVDLTNCSKMTFTGLSSNGKIRLFYNWDGTDGGKPTETLDEFPKDASGKYVFDIDAFKNKKGITFFHLNGIKTEYGQTATISEITVDEYTNVISGSGIDRTKTYLSNPYLTFIDVTGLTNTSAIELTSANPNCLFIANSGKLSNTKNVITSGTCANLVLEDNHPFKAPADFTATAASYTTTITAAGAGTLCLPFAAGIPDGVTAWTLTYTSGDKATATPVVTTIPANTPVLLNGTGEKTFSGSGAVSASATNVSGALTGVFAAATVPVNSYVLQKQDAKVGFFKVTGAKTINPFRAYLTASTEAPGLSIIFPEDNDVTGISEIEKMKNADNVTIFDLQGRKVAQPQKGLYIVNGKKVIFK